jgi:hypothetical protein
MGLALYAQATSPATDLAGAAFGVDVPVSGFALAMYALAESLGLHRGDYEVVALGSTPKRLTALLAGDCAATMLNAGNELHAEDAGFRALARASVECGPYLGTVLASLRDTSPLRPVLLETAAAIVAGGLGDEVRAEAADALRLNPGQAQRYLDRLRDPAEGLVPDGVTDLKSLQVLVDLRRRYADPLTAFDPADGLLR